MQKRFHHALVQPMSAVDATKVNISQFK